MKDGTEHEVKSDGKCPITGHQCTCIPRTMGHWCCWSVPRTEMEAYRATLGLDRPNDSDDKK